MTEAVNPDISVASNVAFIIDNEVAMIVGVNEKMYAAFKSNPIFIDLKSNDGQVEEKDIYDPITNTFSKPPILPSETPEVIGSTNQI